MSLQKIPKEAGGKKLKVRERKLVQAIVSGEKQLDAMEQAGYALSKTSENAARVRASQKINEPHIQAAIDDALHLMGATPEFAVAQLKKVAEQDDELGAKRLAAKDILELHGWNKAAKPTMKVEFKGDFFNQSRKVIDIEEVNES